MEGTNLEATEAAVERQELREKGMNAENIGSSQDRYEDRRLVERRRRGAKKRIQDSVGSRQKLSAARKHIIRRAVPTMCKGQMRKVPGKDGTTMGAPKGRRLHKTHRVIPGCKTGIWGHSVKKQLHLWTEWTFNRAIRKTTRLEIAKRARLSTIELQDVNDWTLWKLRSPPKHKKDVRTA
jgi:hypothetical protein